MEKILKKWLSDQCRMLSESVQAVLFTGAPGKGPYTPALFLPETSDDTTDLSRIAEAALRSEQPVIKTRGNKAEKTGEPLDIFACPLFLNNQLFGTVAIKMPHRSKPLQKATILQIQAGTKWLETLVSVDHSSTRDQLVNLVDLVATGLSHEMFRLAASEVVKELARRFSCHRVSLGFLNYRRLKLIAQSDSSGIDQHSTIAGTIKDTMNEALDQMTTIVYPDTPGSELMVNLVHARLSSMQQEASVLSLPLVKNGKGVGALVMERSADNPFTAGTVKQCEQIGLLLGPVLENRRCDERPILSKVFDAFQKTCVKLFGPRHLTLKMSVSSSLVLLIWLSLAHTMFSISCDSVLEAGIRRVIVAPRQGYIGQAHVRAGDLVQEGDILARLDDRDLNLEYRKWQIQRDQLLKEHRKALAVSDRSKVAILNAKRRQAEAEIQLLAQQLARTSLVAPFSGLIVKGDLSQALGSPVNQGEVLYEIAPIGEYRVILKVDDRDISLISEGQKGRLKLASIPDQTIPLTIDRLTPVSTSGEGRNYFRVEALLDQRSDLIRPGMEGITRIEIGQEKLIRIWTRQLINRLRLFAWYRLP